MINLKKSWATVRRVMSTIKGILKEEYERLIKLKQRYDEEIKSLPQGTISTKMRKGKKYSYLAYRENNKVKTDYIGLDDSDETKLIRAKIKKRKELAQLLRATKQRLAEIKKIV